MLVKLSANFWNIKVIITIFFKNFGKYFRTCTNPMIHLNSEIVLRLMRNPEESV